MHARHLIEAWRDDYNHHRPHSNLDGLTQEEYHQRSKEDQTLNRTNYKRGLQGKQVKNDDIEGEVSGMPIIVEAGRHRILALDPTGSKLEQPSDANDILGDVWGNEANFVAIPAARLGSAFLKLETRIAGEVFQKFTNYRVGCAILGDISEALAASSALRDFVRETNKGRSVWFVVDLDELKSKLD